MAESADNLETGAVSGPIASWLKALVPTGTVLAYIGTEAPNALFRMCDGSPFEPDTFPELTAKGFSRLPTRAECGGDSVGASINFIIRAA